MVCHINSTRKKGCDLGTIDIIYLKFDDINYFGRYLNYKFENNIIYLIKFKYYFRTIQANGQQNYFLSIEEWFNSLTAEEKEVAIWEL